MPSLKEVIRMWLKEHQEDIIYGVLVFLIMLFMWIELLKVAAGY